MKVKYNAPVTLTFSLLCACLFAISEYLFPALGVWFGQGRGLSLIDACFTVPSSVSFDPKNIAGYLLLFTHIFGHADWNHLAGNLSFVLILGPLLESVYGSLSLALMMLVTGFATGVINVCFFSSPLLGASGVVFMMVLLSSFSNRKKSEVPLTFILVVILFMGREVAASFEDDNVSRFAHLAGGLCGSVFGFFTSPQYASRSPKGAKKGAARGQRAKPGAAQEPEIRLVKRGSQEEPSVAAAQEAPAKKRLPSLFRRGRKSGIAEVDKALFDFESNDSF